VSGYGGRGADDGPGYGGPGYGEPGYDEPGYDDQDYGGQGYGGRRRRPAGVQQPADGPGAAGGRPRHPRQPRGYPGRGPGQPPARGQGYGPPPGRDQDYGQQGGRTDPRGQEQRRPGVAPQYPRGSQQPMPHDAQQQAYGATPRRPRRGADPSWQQQGGYDPRDAYPGGYQGRGDARFGRGAPGGPGAQGGQQGRGGDPGRDSGFLPGFGQGEAGGYPGYENVDDHPRRRGRRGRDDGRGGGGGGDDWDDDGGSGRRRGTIRRLAPWIALLVILTPLVVGGLYIYNIYENKYHPADYSGPGTGSVTVQVKSGDTAFSLGPRLQSLGVVASARAFELAAEHTNSATGASGPPGLEAGFYKMHMHMQASLAWSALLNPKDRVQLTVTIPEGKRASQVVLILAKETSIPASQFQAVINNPAQLGLPSYANGKVEGYLFPATYTIQPNETAAQILKAMVGRFDVEARAINISAAATRLHLTPEQVIIEASLAQAEGGSVADYPKIARVITNRLKIGMHLQFDSTVLYGLGKYAVSATIAQTRTPGPYNTYLNAGLPPGPISNPGDAAIQAVLHPASGNWLYFLTKPGGASEFSTTPLAGQ
jgi:peptidoglycan lytic transglycosylase G